MIKTLSPYYKNIPWELFYNETTPTGIYAEKYLLNVYVWRGLKSSVPDLATVQIENINPLGRTDSTDVNISRFINDFPEIKLPVREFTGLNSADSMVWVKTEVIYYIKGIAQAPKLAETKGAVKGYTYAIEGPNKSTPENNYLATTVEQKVSRKGTYLCSFLGNETEDYTISLKSKTYNKTFTVTKTPNTINLISNLTIKVEQFDGEFIEIYKDDILMNTLLITDEPTFNPIDLVFLNKEGQLQSITFFKEKITKLKVEREGYESSFGQPINGVHQYKDYNVNGRESFSMNSGFVKEDNNEVFTQLLLSRTVWELKDGVYIPLNLGTSEIEYKSRFKDRLINYKIDFKYSFSKINNI